jgi:hypothetical protein
MSHLIQKRFSGKRGRPVLAQDFALRLIDKEVELDRNCSLAVIQELVQLYTDAIEFYAYIKDSKSDDFRDRMHKMFMRPDVISAIKLKTPSNPTKQSTMQERRIESVQKKSEEAGKMKELMQTQSEKGFVRVLEYQTLRSIEVARKAAMDFKSQDKDLQKRLDSRKKSMLTKSMDSGSRLNMSTSRDYGLKVVKEEDDCEVASFCRLIEEVEEEPDLEEDLERIMDRYCSEKAKRMAEVQVKYETEMAAIGDDGPIFEQVRNQMKKDMQNEIFSVCSEIEKEKGEEILRLKNRHHRKSISLS